MYKNLFKKGIDFVEQQQNRQRELLRKQKLSRENQQDEHRHLPEISDRLTRKRRKRKARTFFDIYGVNLTLQLSEWLRHCPEDLCDWLLVPCPRGQRCMVVACNGRTEVYNKGGRRYMNLHTQLPGDGIKRKSMTLLDCIYAPTEDTFYVLDALSYGNQDLIECEAQFRFFWLRSKFDDHEELLERSEKNEKPFQLLQKYDFENATRIAMGLQLYPHWCDNKPELDGFLFYHKEASYTHGTTPLVCWLFPFMIKDVIGLSVSAGYVTPADYTTPQEYMAAFDERLALKQKRWKHKKDLTAMDAELATREEMETDEYEDNSLQKLLDDERRLELGEADDDWVELPAAYKATA